ncbi:hypothetical protein HYW11_02920 [Candidatus Peregrinibacteria bacterium]|nr:hypothetical protein [Candidatus Peregrinibacteria bacterium]
MIYPRELYADWKRKTSSSLQALMRLMGLDSVENFAMAAQCIHQAGWSKMSSLPPEERTRYQERLPEFQPSLKELGVLWPFPDAKNDARLSASEIVWPGESARQVVERLRPGIRAIIENRVPNVTKLTALAALRRKPVGNELEYLGDLVIDPRQCVEGGQVLEGAMMQCVWERMKVDYNGTLKYLRFAVVTTDQVPPEALHSRPTNFATLAAWWHLNPNPRRVCVTSVAPYGYRFWYEAHQYFPECSWELLAPVPENPNGVGAIYEVGKIVYNLAKLMA